MPFWSTSKDVGKSLMVMGIMPAAMEYGKESKNCKSAIGAKKKKRKKVIL